MSDSSKDQKKAFAVRTFAADLAANQPTPAVSAKSKVIAKVAAKAVTEKKMPLKAEQPMPEEKSKPLTSNAPSTQIPPFHAFQKPGPRKAPIVHIKEEGPIIDAAVLTAIASKQRTSILTTPSHGVLVGDAEKESQTATIITDTKYRQFSLGSSITKKITSWFEDKKDIVTGKKKPKYSVPQADRRKGVIQKATSLTGRASVADHAQVLERLRHNKKNPAVATAVPAVIEPKSTAPSWEGESSTTHKEESHTPISFPSVPTKSVVAHAYQIPERNHAHSTPEIIKEPILPAAHISTVPVHIEPNPQPHTPPPTPVLPAVLPSVPVPQVEIVVAIPTMPQPIVVPVVTPQAAPEPRTPAIIPTIPKVVKTNPTLESWFADTNRIVLGGAVVMIGLLMLWGTVNMVTPILFPNATDGPAVRAPLFATSVQQQLSISGLTREEIMKRLRETTQSSEPLLELELFAASTTNLITPTEFFTQLEIDESIAFTAAINVVTPGAYRNEPFLALLVVNEATALGGMLNWEKRMNQDLISWFGTNIETSAFRDESIASTDVRVLRNASGAIVIVYGFIRPNIIVITTSENAFLNLQQNLPE